MNQEIGTFKSIYRMDLEKYYEFAPHRIWEAITQPDQIKSWMEYPAKVDLRIGGKYHLDFGNEGAIDGVICQLEPDRRLTYTWGDSLIKWEMESVDKGTKVVFSHIGLTEKNAVELGAGWQAFIEYLDPFLRGLSFPKNPHDRLMKEYEKAFQNVS